MKKEIFKKYVDTVSRVFDIDESDVFVFDGMGFYDAESAVLQTGERLNVYRHTLTTAELEKMRESSRSTD